MSSSPSIAELRGEAEALGLEGEEILNFVYNQQELHRDERAAERAARAAETEAQLEIVWLHMLPRLNVLLS